MSLGARRRCVDFEDERLTILRQCHLLGLARSNLYYTPVPADRATLTLMHAIDREYTARPFFGVRRITVAMREHGFEINHKRIARLMRLMGIQAVYPGPKLSNPAPNHTIYPYLLRNVSITEPNHVWSSDITYIPMERGFMYCAAVIDWFSRYVLAWDVSNTQDAGFCASVLAKSLRRGTPTIFNTDQGSQFTSEVFLKHLLEADIKISMDGRGRALDNVFIERLWRSLKYEDVYLHHYGDPLALREGVGAYFRFYNRERCHQSLNYRTPADLYFER